MNARTGKPPSTEVARETLRSLAVRRIAPTPDNYARVYRELAGEDAADGADPLALIAEVARELRLAGAAGGERLARAIDSGDAVTARRELRQAIIRRQSEGQPDWGELLAEFATQWDARQARLTRARKRAGLESVIAHSGRDAGRLHGNLRALVTSWKQAPPGTAETGLTDEPPPGGRDAGRLLREMLARTLERAVVPRLGYSEALARQAAELAGRVRAAATAEDMQAQAKGLRALWLAIELRGQTQSDVLEALLSLLRLLIRNVAGLLTDDSWVRPQIERIEELLAGEPDVAAIREVECALREVIVRQGTIRHSLDEAKNALKGMVGTFIERLGELGASTGEFQQRIGVYAEKIQGTDDLAGLSTLIESLARDTRHMQTDMQRTHDELVSARRTAEAHEAKVKVLESELVKVSELVREDPLTGTLNRRGLDEAIAGETARADRGGEQPAIAVLDLDNFKQLNDRLGHQAGDAALRHLTRIIRDELRPSDTVARLGGEEFVIFYPATSLEDARAATQRVQRALTRRFFLHNNERLLITFSAGVTRRRSDEARETMIARADAAMYEAKRTGKNRVVVVD